MSYLITLTTRKGDTVLDPFIGSGTTAIAAYWIDRHCIGFEREQQYHAIAVERIAKARAQSKLAFEKPSEKVSSKADDKKVGA